jgi:hypothetical protein
MLAKSRFTWSPGQDTDPKDARPEPSEPPAASPPPSIDLAPAPAPAALPARIRVDRLLRLPAAFEPVEVNMTHFGDFAIPSLS